MNAKKGENIDLLRNKCAMRRLVTLEIGAGTKCYQSAHISSEFDYNLMSLLFRFALESLPSICLLWKSYFTNTVSKK